MRALIIGYGSIGRRHEQVLSNISEIEHVSIVSKQKLDNRIVYEDLKRADLSKYDYFIISSETSKHYDQLACLESNVEKKLILCEKPLFHKNIDCSFTNNQIYVGYVMRYHPVIQRLKKLIEEYDENIVYANVICGQYLPDWRPNQDYRATYSASKALGGGVLKDLSHEVDYAQFLFGNIVDFEVNRRKVSNLEIDTDDCSSIYARTAKNTELMISLDYLSRIPIRQVVAHSNSTTYVADLIELELKIKKDSRPLETIKYSAFDRDYLYTQMHKDILSGSMSCVCSFADGLKSNLVVNQEN